MQIRLAAIIAFLFAGVAPSAQANVIITAEEIGGNVVISGGGTLNIDAWTAQLDGFTAAVVDPNTRIILGPTGTIATDLYDVAPASFSGPLIIGPGLTATNPDSGSGDLFGIAFGAGKDLWVPDNYVSLASLNATTTYNGVTVADLGMAPGMYKWSWGTGEGESFTMNIVPEPSTAALTALGLIGMAARRRRA